MRALKYLVKTNKGNCTVKTLARAQEIAEMYNGAYEMVLENIPAPASYLTKEQKENKVLAIKLKRAVATW